MRHEVRGANTSSNRIASPDPTHPALLRHTSRNARTAHPRACGHLEAVSDRWTRSARWRDIRTTGVGGLWVIRDAGSTRARRCGSRRLDRKRRGSRDALPIGLLRFLPSLPETKIAQSDTPPHPRQILTVRYGQSRSRSESRQDAGRSRLRPPGRSIRRSGYLGGPIRPRRRTRSRSALPPRRAGNPGTST